MFKEINSGINSIKRIKTSTLRRCLFYAIKEVIAWRTVVFY